MIILGIDTSCDETSASVVEDFSVLSNVMPSQGEFHAKYGGVVPSLAKLAHEQRIDDVVIESLKRAGKKMEEVDAVAVTVGPGLAMALEVGIRKAKELALEFSKPIIFVNHMEGHLFSSFAQKKPKTENLKTKNEKENVILRDHEVIVSKDKHFPALGFLISGGHTELLLVEDFGKYTKIGETVDDACGEAYDKCGRMLGLGYPAGPVISKFAKENRKNFKFRIYKNNLSTLIEGTNTLTGAVYELPIGMANSKDYNFSYSGLKTAFSRLIKKEGDPSTPSTGSGQVPHRMTKEKILDLCVIFEASAIEQLKFKLEKAIKEYSPKQVWVGGGVVASARLRSELRGVCKKYNVELLHPYSMGLTGDNGAMIGVVGISKAQKGLTHSVENGVYTKDFESIERKPNLSL